MAGLIGLGLDIALPAALTDVPAVGEAPSPPRRLRRSRVPRSFGSKGGFIASPSPDLPASIFRGADNPFSPPSPGPPPIGLGLLDSVYFPDEPEPDTDLDLDLDFDVDPSYTASRHRPRDLALLSPPIMWERSMAPGLSQIAGSKTAPGPGAYSNFPDPNASPSVSSAPPSPSPSAIGSPSPTLPSASIASASAVLQSAAMGQTDNMAVNPLFAASVALSVVLGVILMGLATCGLIKCRQRRVRGGKDEEAEGSSSSTGRATKERASPLPASRSSMSFSASPSFATAQSFHTTRTANSTGPASHPQSILLNSASALSVKSAGGLSTGSHTRRISFLEVAAPINSIEDIHRQLYAPPGWHPGMPWPENYTTDEYTEPYHLQAVQYIPEPVVDTTPRRNSLTDGVFSGTPLDTIAEEDSGCGSEESAGTSDSAAYRCDSAETLAYILPSIPSVADESLVEAMGMGMGIDMDMNMAPDGELAYGHRDSLGSSDSQSSDMSIVSTHFGDADSSFSTAAPGTPRASSSEPSLRTYSRTDSFSDDDEGYDWATGKVGRADSKRRTMGASVERADVRAVLAHAHANAHAHAPNPAVLHYRIARAVKVDSYAFSDELSDDDDDGDADADADADGESSPRGRPASRMSCRSADTLPYDDPDSAVRACIPHEESVLGALLSSEETEMDARRAAFTPRALARECADSDRRRSVKRSRSFPAKLLGRARQHDAFNLQLDLDLDLDLDLELGIDATPRAGDTPSKHSRRSEQYTSTRRSVLRRAYRALKQSQSNQFAGAGAVTGAVAGAVVARDGALGVESTGQVQLPAFQRFSGASWDALEDFDPYYTEAEAPEGSDADVDEESDGDERSRWAMTDLGHADAQCILDNFPQPASHLPHIRITSH